MSHSRSAEAEGAGGAGRGASGLFWGCADSRTRIGEPCETLSPSLILSSFTTPAPGDGISIVALSDSRVTSDGSFAPASPGVTRTSMTSTSLKAAMSGTCQPTPALHSINFLTYERHDKAPRRHRPTD